MVAVARIPMAELLDVWGRAEGFALMVGFSILGTVLMATSKNLATFCAAEVSGSSNETFPSPSGQYLVV